MGNILKLITYISVLTSLMDLVRTAQEAYRGRGKGESKREFVLAKFTALVDTLANTGLIKRSVADLITGNAVLLINAIVEVFKTAGVFDDHPTGAAEPKGESGVTAGSEAVGSSR